MSTAALIRASLPALILVCLAACGGGTGTAPGVPEEVVRHNILGTAYLGQQKWADAERAFQRGLELRPGEPLMLNNSAVALIQQGRVEEAEALLQQALSSAPEFAHAHYNMGLILKNRGEYDSAVRHFEAVAARDPRDLLTQYNLGIVYSRTDRVDDAERAFRNVLDQNPAHVSTLYAMGRFLLQRGEHDEGARMVTLSQEIRARSGLDEAVGSQYGEQGPYAMGVDFAGDSLQAPPALALRFNPVTGQHDADVAESASAMTFTRARGSADRAVVWIASGSRFGSWSAAEAPGLATPREGRSDFRVRALAGGVLARDGSVEALALIEVADDTLELLRLRPDADGGFTVLSDATLAAASRAQAQGAIAAADLTLVDRDHDGDLDLFWCWSAADGAECRFGTNDGSGNFAVSSSDEHGFELGSQGDDRLRVGFTDIDNDRDVDLVVLHGGALHVFANQRDGTFTPLEAQNERETGMRDARDFAIVDLDKDGWMDVVVGTASGLQLLANRFGRLDPPAPLAGHATAVDRLVVLDADNDGFLDLIVAADDGSLSAYRNGGAAGWTAVSDWVDAAGAAWPLAVFDADADGDLDVVVATSDGASALLRNDGGNARHWIAIDSRGVGDNAFGIGAKIEVLAGALRQKFEVTDPAPLHVGLGERTSVESVRYLWPGGVLQDEINQPVDTRVEVTQLDRKGTSCPLLYAWRDGGWKFVTDFLGGCAIGYAHRAGVYGTPDTDEYVRITGGLDTDDAGTVRVRLNNQLQEVIWFDRVELLAIDHPEGSEVFPNERLMPGPPWPAFKLFASHDLRPVLGARTLEDGVDRTSALAATDRVYAGGFGLLPFKGYAEPHTLELDLGSWPSESRVVLLLDGWIDYADSTANVAANQAGLALQPPRLTVADGAGGWIATGHRMGFPAGLPKTMTVELTGLFPTQDHRLRIATNMRIYWDRARVMVGGEELALHVRRIEARQAELRFGGFPAETSPDGRPPFAYDPDDVRAVAPWKAHVGRYTAFGDVGNLIAALDDRFVTTRSGDEIELVFDAPEPPEAGFSRTWLLYADGFGKDMDPNSGANSEVGPIPFHGMPTYPYGDDVVPPVPVDGKADRYVPPSPRGWPGAVPQPLVTGDVAPAG